jgi:DNA repair protein SbcC/Rad50
MKPIKLTMQAFGPYSEKVELNMEKLDGLYLVCGDTGSGKTMLFDAMTYALYGCASGDIRSDIMFRSKFARPDDMTYAELEFENKGKRYTVYREVGREKTKRNGERAFTKSNEAHIVMPDGSVISRSSDVAKAVRDIIGLDETRFRRTVMVAQGEFRKLLLADTNERIEILRQIFGTESFEYFSEKSKALAAEKKSNAAIIADNTDKYASMLEVDSEKLKKAISDGVRYAVRGEFGDMLRSELDCEKNEIQSLTESSQDTNAELKKISAKLNKAEHDMVIEKKLKEAEENLEVCGNKRSTAKENADKVPEYRDNMSALREKIINNNTVCEKLRERDSIRLSIVEIGKELKNKNAEKSALDEKLGNLTKQADETDKSIKEKRARAEKLPELTEKQAEINFEKKNIDFALGKIREYESIFSQSELCRKKYENKRTEYSTALHEYNTASQSYFDSIAGILAQGLRDGEECPVCGSVEHPKPAMLGENNVTRENLDMQEEALKKQKETLEKYAQDLGIFSARLDDILKALRESKLYCGSFDETEKAIQDAAERNKVEAEKINRSIDELKKLNISVVEDERKLDIMRSRCEEYKKALGDKTAETVWLASLAEEKKRTEEEMNKSLPNTTAVQLEKENKAMKAKADELEKLSEDAEAELRKAESAYEAALSVKKTLEKQLGDNTAAKYDELKHEYAECETKSTEIMSELIRKNTVYEKNVSCSKKLWEELEKLDEAEKNASLYALIANTANGNVNGKEKITLEAFWQMRLFDRIIRRANIRLMKMSSGRYELMRKTDIGLQKNHGLDLDIKDHWNGKSRDVKTLSGGESFMASLALSLALSDETEAESGGIHIDSVFIDEGFGSLDSDSLDNALSVLASQAGGRSIGIISHIDALKEKIDKKIVVKKGRTTSTAQVIT